MVSDWSMFDISADRDGEMEFCHEVKGCGRRIELEQHSYASISELMERAEEHLKECPLRTIEGDAS